ncbi:MAG: CPBP family intramembrane glutamic endopeptidase [Bacteroidia bacterium]
MGSSFFIIYLIKKRKTSDNSFNIIIENKRIIQFLILVTIAVIFGVLAPLHSLIPMTESFKKALMEFISHKGIFTFLLLVIGAPILEELIFRGIILNGFLKKYPPTKSILISSFLFGLLHLNPWQFLSGLIIGIFSGRIYYRTKSLSPSIIIHVSANLTGFLLLYFTDTASSMDDTLLEMYGGLTNLIAVIVSSILILAVCIYFLKKEFARKKVEMKMQINL